MTSYSHSLAISRDTYASKQKDSEASMKMKKDETEQGVFIVCEMEMFHSEHLQEPIKVESVEFSLEAPV